MPMFPTPPPLITFSAAVYRQDLGEYGRETIRRLVRTYRAWRNSNLLPLGVHSCAMKEVKLEKERE